MDRLTPERRSWLMSRVRGKDTTPELKVRSLLHGMGLRFRLHAAELPGKPDVVVRPRRLAIFVHGCFWHRHGGCRYATTPKSRSAFWNQKFETNVTRDRRNIRMLRRTGWRVLVIWQCQTKNVERLRKRLESFVNPSTNWSERGKHGSKKH
ncbi:MAG: DNA mismatch endonuclease Vsr [Alphaproteobacteria bacterium]|nr:DNA mismatch endonuclease Vsr [Alphaproteobacteria bacterium]